MAFKLDDLINKKKEPNQILDLSKVKIRNKEEFEKYFDKIPEYKIRPEKIREEDVRVRDSEFTFMKKDSSVRRSEYSYGDPVPPIMRSVRLEDLSAVDISWRMLTMLRPDDKTDEELFNRIVELGKFKRHTLKLEGKLAAFNSGVIVSKNKHGVSETRLKTCKECGVELCTGNWCKDFPYESYTRMLIDKDEIEEEEGESKRKNSKGKVKNKGIKLRRKKRKKKLKPKNKSDSD